MSDQAFNDFRSRVAKDKALAAACRKACASGKRDEIVKLAALAKSHGFEFTVAEAEAVLAQAELSDLELELVAGGTPVGGAGQEGKRMG